MLKPTKFNSKFGKKELDHFFEVAKLAKKNQAFTILKAPSQQSFGRILAMVPKKYGTSPERNRLKRQLKAIFTQNKLYEYKLDLIFITRPTAKNYDFSELTQLLFSLFEKN